MVREEVVLVALALAGMSLSLLLAGLPEGRSEVFYKLPQGRLVLSTPTVLQDMPPGVLYIPRVDRKVPVRELEVYTSLMHKGWTIYIGLEGEEIEEFLAGFGIGVSADGEIRACPPGCSVEAYRLVCAVGGGRLIVLKDGAIPPEAVVDLSNTRVSPLLTLFAYLLRGFSYGGSLLPLLVFLTSLALLVKNVVGYIKRSRR